MNPATGAWRARLRTAGAFAALLGVAAVLRWALAQLGEAAAAILLAWPPSTIGTAVAGAVLGLFGALVGLFVFSRLSRGRRVALHVAGVALVAAVLYRDSLRGQPFDAFDPAVVALQANGTVEDQHPNRPHYPYRLNQWGFREPGFELARQPGRVRVVAIGDSYVFGIGVPVEETLSRHLQAELARRHPGRDVEVVNLGMPGNNFVSYIDVYRAAQGKLAPDVVVLCLTLPNDLSRWDWGTEWREAHRLSPYSAVRFVLGSHIGSALWGQVKLESAATPEAVARFRDDVARLLALRPTGAPPLFVFQYQFEQPFVAEAFTGRAGVHVVHGAVDDPAYYIPGDGHPTGAGNRRFAALLADAIDVAPETAALWR